MAARLALAALLAAAAATTASAATFAVGEAITYVSGRNQTLDEVPQEDEMRPWHDVSSVPLVVKLTLTHESEGSLNTPTASFLQLSGNPRAPGTTVRVSAPAVNNTEKTVSWQITFSTSTYGIYTIAYRCGDLEDNNGNMGEQTCTSKIVQIGYTPTITIRNAANAVVGSQWLDGTLPYTVNVAPSGDFVFSTSIISAGGTVPDPDDVFTIDDASVTGMTLDVSRGLVSGIAYTLDLDEESPGTRTVDVAGGYFKRSDGVGNVPTSFVVKTGFNPILTFEDGDNKDEEGSPFWFRSTAGSNAVGGTNVPASTVSLVISAEGLVPSPTAYTALFGSAGVPGLSAKPGGIVASGAPTLSTDNTSYIYPINIANLPAGTYTFTLPQGVLQSETAASAAVTATLRIGFVPTIRISNAGGLEVTTQWLNPNLEGYSITVRPPTGAAFGAATIADAPDVDDSFQGPMGASVALNDSSAVASASGVTYSLVYESGAASIDTFEVVQGTFVRSDGVRNTFTTFDVKTGFAPELSFVDEAAEIADGWFNAASSSVKLNISAPMEVLLSETVPAWATAANGLFAGASSLPTPGGVGVRLPGGESIAYPITISALTPGNYTFSLPQGALGAFNSSLRSHAVSGFLLIGYLPEFKLLDAESREDVTGQWVDLTTRDHVISVGAGLGFTWDKDLNIELGGAAVTFDEVFMPPANDDSLTGVLVTGKSNAARFEYQVDAGAIPATYVFPVNQGALLRSDGLGNAPTTFTLKAGFAPRVTFADALSNVDDGEDSNEIWFSTLDSGAAKLVINGTEEAVITNMPAWTIAGLFSGLKDTPASNGLSGSGAAIADGDLSYTLAFSSLAPGIYPVTIPSGVITAEVNGSVVRNARVSGDFKVGATPVLTIEDKEGADVTEDWLDATRTLFAKVTVSGEGAAAFAASLRASGVGAVPVLNGSFTADRLAFDANSVSVFYPLLLEETVGTLDIAVSDVGGDFCTSSDVTFPGRLCTARAAGPLAVKLGYVPTAKVEASSNDYRGQLDGDLAVNASSAPVPTLATAFTVTFSHDELTATTGSWANHFIATPGLQAPNSAVATAGSYVLTWSALAATAPGAYDIVLKPSLLGAGAKNARVGVRVVVGFVPSFEAYEGGSEGPAIYQRSTNGPYITAATDLLFRVNGMQVGSFPLGSVLEDVTDATGKSVKNAIAGLTSSPVDASAGEAGSAVYLFGVAGLTDGTYTVTFAGGEIDETPVADFYGASTNTRDVSITLIVDRTAPAVAPATYAGPSVFSGRPLPGNVVIPATLFNDAATPDAKLKISVESLDDKGVTLASETLVPGLLTSGPGVVRAPPGAINFRVTAVDEAGNVASAPFSIPVAGVSGGALTAVDSRNVQSRTRLVTGSTVAADGTLTLTIVGDFEVAVTGFRAASLLCTIGERACATAVSAITLAPASSATGSRRYTWTVRVAAADVNAVRNKEGFDLTFAVSTVNVTAAAGGAPVTAPRPVSVVIDTTAPAKSAGTFVAPVRATVGARYTLTLPTFLFADNASPAGAIRIVRASPASQFGLTFTADRAGVATIAGTPTAQPPSSVGSRVVFDLIAEDEAGNQVTAAAAVAVIINGQSGAAPTFSVAGSVLPFTEGGDDVAVDATARFSWSATPGADEVRVFLNAPEADEGEDSEQLTFTEPADGEATYRVDPATGQGVVRLTTETTLLPADIQAFVRSVKYSNSRDDVTGGSRSVRFDIMRAGAVIASASRVVRVTPVNDVPAVTVSDATATWTEGGAPAVLFSGVSITDADDGTLTVATVVVTGCDAGRDLFFLPGDYAAPEQPAIVGVWTPATCTFTLRPIGAATALPIGAFEAALEAVEFISLDAENPTNGVNEDVDRELTLTVTDFGSSGRLAERATSTAVDGTLTISPVDDAPVINARRAFADGGILSSSDSNANLRTFTDARGVIKQRKFAVVLPAEDTDAYTASTTVTLRIPIDLLRVSAGVFAGGAITDVDTYDAPASGPTVKAVKADGTYAALGELDGLTGFDIFGTDATTTPATTSSFTYSDSANSELVLVVDVANTADDTLLKEYEFVLIYATGVEQTFSVDVRRQGCLLEDADDGFVGIKGDAVRSAPIVARYYPFNSLCSYDPIEILASANTTITVGRGGFDTLKTKLEQAVGDLAALGASKEAQIAALKEVRNAARGSFAVAIPPGSLANRGSIPLQAVSVSTTSTELLPAGGVEEDDEVDLSVAIKLSPAGTLFSEAIKVCIFVGDTPLTSTRVLSIASQVDAGDESKGYSAWEVLSDQSFNIATGELCGYTTHFSVLAPFSRPVPVSETVSKAHLMGGSCPNACSGHGTCRQEGQCVCFAGFSGYDCSMRTCPSAASWGEELTVQHEQTECAGRGVCDRASGECECFDGFEGAACERQSCPNDCSGHGKCRLLSELPEVDAAGYESWEVSRVQACVCDGGYTGADCSLRTCPHGDDPETVCAYTQRQVQQVVLSFPTLKGSSVDADTDQFAFQFEAVDGSVFSTPAIDNIWEGTPDVADSIAAALKSLPQFVVEDVEVTSTATTAASLAVTYSVTFTGLTNTGDEALLRCPLNAAGSYGCNAAGCRPKFAQLRVLDLDHLPTSVSVSPHAILTQPAPINAGDDASTTTWGVETILTIDRLTSGAYTYKFANTRIYGVADADADIAETPVPPAALRTAVPGPYGLLFDFGTDAELSGDFASTPASYTIGWRLPMCEVTLDTAADADLEKAECSNRGVCDRSSGQCSCFAGYTGFSCNQQTVYV